MLSIRALNENTEDNSVSSEEELSVTGEAEEAIVVSEYLRALNYINSNQQNSALFLFLELLQTDVLAKVTYDTKENKLVLVKYNCYRYIGLLYQEKGANSLAVDYLIRAVELSHNDMHTMYILAQLAHKIGHISVAKTYYENCIERNPNHWPSLEGILKLFLSSGNIIEAYCWATNCIKKDNKYKQADSVLHEINNRFSLSISFIEELLQISTKVRPLTGRCMPSVATCFYDFCDSECAISSKSAQIDILSQLFKIHQLNWVTLANWIILIHKHLESNGQVMHNFSLAKFIEIQANIEECDSNINESFLVPEGHLLPDETENQNNKSTDLLIELETKSRRRGSELKILEQWGWHKSRRSSRKKSVYENPDPVESTADEFMKRVLGQYFEKSYDENKSPFSDQPYEHKSVYFKNKTITPGTIRHFINHSKTIFNDMTAEMKHRETDIYLMTYFYLQNLSLYWNETMPQELCTLYIQIYGIFATYNSYQSWHQQTNNEISILIRMDLFYLELFHDREKWLNMNKSENTCLFQHITDGIQLYVSYLPEENYIIYYSRYLWLNYAISMHNYDIDAAARKLTQIYSLLDEQPDTFEICLPNQRYNNFLNKCMVQQMIESLQRQINLRTVKELYAGENYHAVETILTDSLIHTTNVQSNIIQTMNITMQIEILLECFWQLEQFSDCIIWAEKSLKYTVDTYVSLQVVPYRHSNWTKAINFILLYIQTLIEKEGSYIMNFELMPRMVQTIHKILNNQLDTHYDKHLFNRYTIDCWRAWVILYYVLERQDDQTMMYRKNRGMNREISLHDLEEEPLFSSIMLFFVAHELLGRRQWCSKGNNKLLLKMLDVIVPKLRSPMCYPYRDLISECLEQTTFCLFGYPPRKGRTRHLQDHESTTEILSWERSVQLFDIYRPDVLPEYNSYKIDSISADMEALFQQILLVMPESCNASLYVEPIMDFINGKVNNFPKPTRKDILCLKVRPIYYFLADFYFKSRDFSKAIRYYAMDLIVEPMRFDSWAGIALSKASKCETILNSAEILSCMSFLNETKNTIRCFEQSLMLNEHDPQLWVEYGSFAYNISSYCARALKSSNESIDSLSYLKSQQVYYMNISKKSFEKVNSETINDHKDEFNYRSTNDDEKWLYHYMLGKIAEKRKEPPMVYLAHYLKAAKCLYECNATYPIKVNHSNPSHLSIEALEVFYRANAAIIKFTEQHSSIAKHEAGLFKQILKELAVSPFAVNRAKINDVTFKRKLIGFYNRTQNFNSNTSTLIGNCADLSSKEDKFYSTSDDQKLQTICNITQNQTIEPNIVKKLECSSRRISQESISATNTTTTTTSIATSSSGTDFPDSDSESDSSTSDENSCSSADRDSIFKDCIKNMEECVTRFPEHYKSIHRLAYHYMNAPGDTRSLEKCSQLMLGSYKTTLGNQIPGLFTERRSNNFFNGIWRIPSSDIDRPGSFSSHLSKCVTILIQILKHNMDHDTLLDVAIQLYRRPDADKEYLKDYDRNELSQKTISTCIYVYHTILNKLKEENKDKEILNLLVDIFKAYRKCVKSIQHKELPFTEVMTQAYKIYIQNKAKLPETANIVDLAVKLCTYEINYRKSIEKISAKKIDKTSKIISLNTSMPSTMITPMQPISASFIPGLTKQRKTTAPKSVGCAVAPVINVTRVAGMGPSITSPSLPGLTITPMNVLSSSRQESISESPDYANKFSSGSCLLPNSSHPELVTDVSRTYVNSYSNKNIDDVPINYNRLMPESFFFDMPLTNTFLTTDLKLNPIREDNKQ